MMPKTGVSASGGLLWSAMSEYSKRVDSAVSLGDVTPEIHCTTSVTNVENSLRFRRKLGREASTPRLNVDHVNDAPVSAETLAFRSPLLSRLLPPPIILRRASCSLGASKTAESSERRSRSAHDSLGVVEFMVWSSSPSLSLSTF